MSNNESFVRQTEFFKRYYRVIAPDFTGFGKSKKMSYAYNLDDFVLEIKNLLDEINASKVDVIAHSFGARVALKLSLTDNRINKMVLTGAAGIKPKRSLKYHFKVFIFKAYKKLFKNGKFKGFESADYKMLSGIEKKSFVLIVNEHLDDILKDINNDTLILSGDKDSETPPYMQKRLNKKLKNSKLTFIKGAGHFAFVSNPYEFNLKAREFLLGD